jgi:exonuclease VII small subunit
MTILNKINDYFKELKKKDIKTYNKRIVSFEKIINAIEKGDDSILRNTIKNSIAKYDTGFSTSYANLLETLQLTFEKDGMRLLQEQIKLIDFIFHTTLSEKEDVPLTINQRRSSVY